MNKKITKVFIALCVFPLVSVPFERLEPSADTLSTNYSTDISKRSITGGFLGILDAENPISRSIILTSPDFVPNYITIDIYDGGPQDLLWYMAVGNMTTNTVLTPHLNYQPGVKRMIIRLDGISKGDKLVFFMQATSGSGEIHLRATLSNVIN